MSSRRLFVLGMAIAGTLCILWVFLSFPVSRPIKPGLRTLRVNNVVNIRNVLRDYYETNNSFPETLSGLFRQLSANTNLDLFFSPKGATNGTWFVSQSALTNHEMVDTYGYYVYVGSTASKSGIILYERPGIWITGADNWLDKGLFVIDKDFNVFYLPTSSVERSFAPRPQPP